MTRVRTTARRLVLFLMAAGLGACHYHGHCWRPVSFCFVPPVHCHR